TGIPASATTRRCHDILAFASPTYNGTSDWATHGRSAAWCRRGAPRCDHASVSRRPAAPRRITHRRTVQGLPRAGWPAPGGQPPARHPSPPTAARRAFPARRAGDATPERRYGTPEPAGGRRATRWLPVDSAENGLEGVVHRLRRPGGRATAGHPGELTGGGTRHHGERAAHVVRGGRNAVFVVHDE